MGKKTKKTKWRTLEIPPPGKNYETANGKWDDGRRTPSTNYQHCDKITKGQNVKSNMSTAVTSSSVKFSDSKEIKTLIEDEYTKITTPRQDVLFKKGYLTKRKVAENTCETTEQNVDGIAQDCTNNEDFSNYANGDDALQQFVCTPQPYIDPSAIYYGGGYEIYDPYTGSVTAVVMGPTTSQYPTNNPCQPILTSIPCRPVPLQSVQWFNPVPSSDWCCSYSQQNGKRYSTDSQNGSGVSSESGAPESPNEAAEEQVSNPIYPPSYVYPGYMFGTPVYNIEGVDVQYCAPESPALSSSESTTSKRKKKRKRRRKTGENEEGSESSIDDNSNGSVSSSECILDSTSPTEAECLEYEESTENDRTFNYGTDLPHANVNAPAFVPATYQTCDTVNNLESSVDIFVDDDQTCSKSGLNVYCKPYDNNENKHDLASSNNSDSGISSPSSEDNSHKASFRNGAENSNECNKVEKNDNTSLGDRTDDKSKKSRSKKSKSKNKRAKENRSEISGEKLKSTTTVKEKNTENDVKTKRKSSKGSKKTEARNCDVANVNENNESWLAKNVESESNSGEIVEAESFPEKVEEKTTKTVSDCDSVENKLQISEPQETVYVEIQNDTKIEAHDGEESLTSGDRFADSEDLKEMELGPYIRIEEKPVLAKLVDVENYSDSEDSLEELSLSSFSSCRETDPKPPPRRRHRKVVEVARAVVDEIVEQAEAHLLSSEKCDKFQLPITQAVTNWLNEHGGLVVAEEANASNAESGENEVKDASKKSSKSQMGCVIC